MGNKMIIIGSILSIPQSSNKLSLKPTTAHLLDNLIHKPKHNNTIRYIFPLDPYIVLGTLNNIFAKQKLLLTKMILDQLLITTNSI